MSLEVAAAGLVPAPPAQVLAVTLAGPADVKFAAGPRRAPKGDSGNAVMTFDAIAQCATIKTEQGWR